MPSIRRYRQDPNVDLLDQLIGRGSETGITYTYTIESIIDLLNQNLEVGPGSNTRYVLVDGDATLQTGQAKFGTTAYANGQYDLSTSGTHTLFLYDEDANGGDQAPYFGTIGQNTIVRIAQTGLADIQYAIYTVNAAPTESSNIWEINITLTAATDTPVVQIGDSIAFAFLAHSATGPRGRNIYAVPEYDSFDNLRVLTGDANVAVGDYLLVANDNIDAEIGNIRRIETITDNGQGTTTVVGNIRGPQGTTGQTGPAGPQGDPGTPGTPGAQGAQGFQGVYTLDVYQVVRNTDPAPARPATGDFQFDSDGTPSVLSRVRGLWNLTPQAHGANNIQYSSRITIEPQNTFFQTTTPVDINTSLWSAVFRTGTEGAEGQQGPAGPAGAQGDQGVGIQSIVVDGTPAAGDSTRLDITLIDPSDNTTSGSFIILPPGATGATGQDGQTGPMGVMGYQGVYTLDVYQVVGSTDPAPTKPQTGEFTFDSDATPVLAKVSGDWELTPQSHTASQVQYVSRIEIEPQVATFQVTTPTSLNANLWSNVFRSGTEGPAGPRGQTGPQGDPGTPGAAAALDGDGIGTVTTGAAGTNAAVNINGDAQNIEFDFTIPRGNTGATGAAAGFGTATVSEVAVDGDDNSGQPTISSTGPDTARIFSFGIPTGATGARGEAGTNGMSIAVFYSTAATGGTISQTYTNQDFIRFVLFTAGETPTTPSSSDEFTRFTGAQGNQGLMGDVGARGPQGRFLVYIYDNIPSSDSAPTISGNSIYTYSTGAISSLPTGFSSTYTSPATGETTYFSFGTVDPSLASDSNLTDPIVWTQPAPLEGIPVQGEQGPSGPMGDQGLQGERGLMGLPGAQGDQGISRVELYNSGTSVPAPTGVTLNTSTYALTASGGWDSTYSTGDLVSFALVNPADFPDSGPYSIPNSAWSTPVAGAAQGPAGPAGPAGADGMNATNPQSFTRIDVAGQAPVIAERVADRLTLIAGSGLVITTDANSDAIEIGLSGQTPPVDQHGTIDITGITLEGFDRTATGAQTGIVPVITYTETNISGAVSFVVNDDTGVGRDGDGSSRTGTYRSDLYSGRSVTFPRTIIVDASGIDGTGATIRDRFTMRFEASTNTPFTAQLTGDSNVPTGIAISEEYTVTQSGFTVVLSSPTISGTGLSVAVDSTNSNQLNVTGADTVAPGRYTLSTTATYTETANTANTGSVTLTEEINVFQAYFYGVQTTVPTAFIPNSNIVFSNVSTGPAVNGTSVTFTGGAQGRSAVLNLHNDITPTSFTVASGGFMLTTTQFPSFAGTNYTTYYFPMSNEMPLTVTINT